VLGAAINVSEAVVLGGKRNGRHFLPIPRFATVGTNGALTAGDSINVSTNWTSGPGFFLGGAVVPGVISSTGVFSAITGITVRSRISFLRTRSR
jgi:hypothetical protein